MSSPYIGEIRMFAGNFAPAGWAFCNGALVPISENDTLFNLIGTIYGGDGQETFALPNLQGRVPLHAGRGPGISQTYNLGETGGVESVTITTQTTPIHSHPFFGTNNPGGGNTPTNNILARATGDAYTSTLTAAPLKVQALTTVGGSQPHENMQPFLAVSFIISLFGIFPTQS